MSFLVVNTGRAASRAFYLNLKRQEGVLSLSRYALDGAIKRYLRKNRAARLRRFVKAYQLSRELLGRDVVPGLVLHDYFPIDHPRIKKALEFLRDELSIETVFFPVRPPRGFVRSQLNRSLADRAGDWAFDQTQGAWRSSYTLEDLAALARRPADPPGPIADVPAFDAEELRAMALAFAKSTGKVHSLFRLFQSVFSDVRYVDYEDFVEHPSETFRRMAAVGGFRFEDESLVHVKLNSLVNRLLSYNPICVIHPRTSRFPRRHRPHVRYRFELSDVLPLCDDWGHYEKLEVDCSEYLGPIEADFGSRLAVGISLEDVRNYSDLEGELLRDPGFVGRMLQGVAPIFVQNYARSREFYRERLYLREIPESVFEAFWEENGAEYEALRDARDRGELGEI
jgi:hypothetical protein